MANKCAKKEEANETAFDREDQLISEYHKQVVISKGDSSFFIPKGEISWYFNPKNFIDTGLAKVGDNISFFDISGNIIYQALLIDTSYFKKKIRCQDLTTGEYYITELNIDSIRGLNSRNVKYLHAYRW